MIAGFHYHPLPKMLGRPRTQISPFCLILFVAYALTFKVKRNAYYSEVEK